ncbi:hypothetical protein [Streptomyces sp. NPDC088915]|uniref:hypothetical protein n=1 Tax=Streptomyces sp. NPDC088915 TaxID=3365912 RepID=UPI00382D051A
MPIPTPGSVASATAARRAHTALVQRLTEERDAAAEAHAGAKRAVHDARWRRGRAEDKRSMLLGIDRHLPPSQARDKGIRDITDYTERMAQAKKSARALHAATGVVLRAAELSLLGATAAEAAAHAPLPTGERAEVIGRAACDTALTAREFTAVTHRPDWRAAGGWIAAAPETWTREYATNIVLNWAKARGAWLLADGAGTLFVVSADRVIELSPVREPVPTEGDVLEAALNAYGLSSDADGTDGVTFRVMPAEPGTPIEDIYNGPHLLLYAGERADRPASEYSEPWSVHLHRKDGDYVDQVYVAPEGLECAEASAACAQAVVSWFERRRRGTVGRALLDGLSALGIHAFADNGDGSTWIVVPRDAALGYTGPHLTVFGWTEDKEASVDLAVGEQTGMTVCFDDGVRAWPEPLFGFEGSDLAPCLRAVVRWALLGPLDDKVREGARSVEEWEKERADVLAETGLTPDEQPADSSALDDALRPYEKDALALLGDLRDLLASGS